jgi:hypothetical protein
VLDGAELNTYLLNNGVDEKRLSDYYIGLNKKNADIFNWNRTVDERDVLKPLCSDGPDHNDNRGNDDDE